MSTEQKRVKTWNKCVRDGNQEKASSGTGRLRYAEKPGAERKHRLIILALNCVAFIRTQPPRCVNLLHVNDCTYNLRKILSHWRHFAQAFVSLPLGFHDTSFTVSATITKLRLSPIVMIHPFLCLSILFALLNKL